NADTRRNANKEKFDRAVSAIDDLLGATRSNDLEVTHLFVGILPESDRIKDHLRFFQGLDSKPNRAHLNHKDFIYFSFPYDRLRALQPNPPPMWMSSVIRLPIATLDFCR